MIVYLCDYIGIDHNLVILDRTMIMSAKIEISVIGQITERRLICGGLITDDQIAHIIPGIGDGDIQCSRIVLFTIRRYPMEGNGILVITLNRSTIPEMCCESNLSAVQMIYPMIVQG